MKKYSLLLIFVSAVIILFCTCKKEDNPTTEFWLTTPDKAVLFKKQLPEPNISDQNNREETITVDTTKKYQPIDGFGFTLTGGSAMHLSKMTAAERGKILTELFSVEGDHIGISYLRISIGASDLDEKVFSYNDLNTGETDPDLNKFSLSYDTLYLIPVLKEILSINPEIKIMGSPWSPPVWMKTNNSAIGGSLKPGNYLTYALYFVRYIEEMRNKGINIDAITVQNEPLHPGNNPSMLMLPEDQAEFIKNHLGPMFQSKGITTKIIIYDHNADRTDYPLAVLNDAQAAQYIDGSAFHLYGGTIDALTKVHDAFPDKNLYFTEQWIGAPGDFGPDLAWHTENLIIGATRNWCKTVLEWNLANGKDMKPHTDSGGCTRCLGAITIDGDAVTRNPAYYIVAHASKFVRPGSVRIESSIPKDLPNVAFLNTEGKTVLIVLNKSKEEKAFSIHTGEENIESKLPAGGVGTYVF